MAHRQIFDDVALNRHLASLSDAEIRLFWCLWGSHLITDDYGNFKDDSTEIRLGAIPYRKGWNERKIERSLDGLVAKGLVIWYEADGVRYGHFRKFVDRTYGKQGYHRKRRHPEEPADIDEKTFSANGASGADGASSANGAKGKERKGKKRKEKEENIYTPEFLEFREVYPKRTNNPWEAAWKKWKPRLKEGWQAIELINAAGFYAEYCRQVGKKDEHIKQATTFLGNIGDVELPFEEFLHGVPKSQRETDDEAIVKDRETEPDDVDGI